MNDKMKLMMDEAWKQWHGNDIDTPKTSPAFERGFRVALEMLVLYSFGVKKILLT